jgi:hypothetical protein
MMRKHDVFSKGWIGSDGGSVYRLDKLDSAIVVVVVGLEDSSIIEWGSLAL